MPLIFSSDGCFVPLPLGHKFPMAKYTLVRRRVESDTRLRVLPSPDAEIEQILLAHEASYVEAILSGTVDPRIMRRIGFPWSRDLVRRSVASVGGTIAAARQALADGVSGQLAGGTHHAFRHEGSGFCVFNDLAVAIYTLRREGLIRRAAVLDLDVHQGDGTASIFTSDPDTLTVSLHGLNNFPFRKQTSGIDVGLPDGTGDNQYLDALGGVLPALWDFGADLILYQSGVDALAEDRLGRLAMTHDGLLQRDRLVFEEAHRRRIPVAITLGGGYAEPLEATVEAHANTFFAAAAVWDSPLPRNLFPQ
jgi:acetoin utilization deacetylase AcuC-like enzyme